MTEIKEEYFQIDGGDFVGEPPNTYHKFKYSLDNFQKHAIKAIQSNDNVLCTAHTGAGKTSLAIESIKMHLEKDPNNHCAFISPIKSLSNQKYKEFKEIFDESGVSNVGILTGDVKINTSARVLIITAEILRNSLYKNKDSRSVYDFDFDEEKISLIVFDEFHFINNYDRGRVWEEIIMKLNPKVQLVMLSATITGADKIGSWIGNLNKVNTHLVSTDFRPVPLNHYIYDWTKRWIWDKNPVIGHPLKCIYSGKKDSNDATWKEGSWTDVFRNISNYEKIKGKIIYPQNVLYDCLKYCNDNEMLPANVFILNRMHIQTIAEKMQLTVTDHKEKSEIEQIWNSYLLPFKEETEKSSQYNDVFNYAMKGIGIHHSGMIAILKEIVEILYEKKLIKILLSTETFAMGVNMPTKTVIFYNVSKFDGRSKQKRVIEPAEYIQMAGRAGRRGMDHYGNVIILPDSTIKSEEIAKKMIKANPQKVESKFQIDYSFILKRMNFIDNTLNTDTNIFEYIANELSKTMFSLEKDKLYYADLEEKKNEINVLKEKANNKSRGINKVLGKSEDHKINISDECMAHINGIVSEENKVIELESMEIPIKMRPNERKKFDKKMMKKKNDIISEIIGENPNQCLLNKSENIFSSFSDLQIVNKEIENLEKFILNANGMNTVFEKQIKLVLDYLTKFNMLKQISDPIDTYKLTSLGKISSEINECNPLIMGFVLQEKLLNDLEFPDIVGVLSCFISEKSKTEIYLSDIDLNREVKSVLEKINNFGEELRIEEDTLNSKLPYTFRSEWNFNLSLFEFAKRWAEGENWVSIKKDYFEVFDFEGNFCNYILRLVQLLKNIESVAMNIDNPELLSKITGCEEKLIRGIVITQSLYV